jgi:thioredoxin-like negative regulator of GroEL
MSTVSAARGARAAESSAAESRSKALLLFFYSPTSGPSRRMDGLVSWLYVRERKRLRLRLVNVDVCADVVERYRVNVVPTLILIKGREVVARLEGKVTGQQIDEAMLPHLRQ